MSALRSSAGPGGLDERRRRARRRRSGPARSCRGRAGRPAARGRAPRRAPAAARIETLELVLQRLLADELVQPPRAQRGVDARPRRALVRGLDAVDVGAGRADHRRASFSAWAIRSSGVSPGAPSSSSSASWGEKPRPTQAVAGEHPRVVAAGDDDRLVGAAAPTFSRSSTTIRSAVRLPIPGTACSRAVSPAATAREQLARRAAGEHGERHLRPDATGRRSAAGTGRAPPRWRSRRAAARRRARSGACGASAGSPDARDVAQRLGGDARAGSRRRRRRRRRGRRGGPRPRRRASAIMPRPRSAAASGAPLAWQIATASASAAWSGRGSSGSASSVWTIRCTWSLAARPEPQTAPLTCCGV